MALNIGKNYALLSSVIVPKPYGDIALSHDGNALYLAYEGSGALPLLAKIDTRNPSNMQLTIPVSLLAPGTGIALTPDDSTLILVPGMRGGTPAEVVTQVMTDAPAVTALSTGITDADFQAQQGRFVD